MFGIASTPAKMMISEQTLARIGRLMKVSTNTEFEICDVRLVILICDYDGFTGAPSPIFCTLETITRSPAIRPDRTT